MESLAPSTLAPPTNISTSPCLLPTLACLFSTLRSRDVVKSYEGYQVIRLHVNTRNAFEQIKSVYLSEQYDFWSPPSMESATDVMVPPHWVASFKTFLGIIGVDFDVIYKDLQTVVDFEKSNYLMRGNTRMTWENYHTVETIHDWMDSMAAKYPALVTVSTFGMSTEGRAMKVMKISSATGSDANNRSAIWIDGGIHAREWISPATVTYMANELILEATRRRTHRLVDNFDYYIVPVMNPDGYAFTMKNDRMWRKTCSTSKRPGFTNLFGFCKGADPNRNWDYKWGGKGTSNSQCSPIYHGEKPASEPEVESSQNFILTIKDRLKLFLTFHSYSQLLLLPWAYDSIRSDDYAELMAVGTKALAALEAQYGTKYKAGATAEMLYAAAGGSFDWAKAVAGVKYSYAFELRDTGRNGFLLPPQNIVPSGKETFAALKSMSEDMMKIYNIGGDITSPTSNGTLFQQTKTS